MHRFLVSALIAVFSFLTLVATAAEALPVLIDRAQAVAAAAKVSVKDYPDADVVLIHDYEKAWYKPDGTGYTVEEVYEKILTEKGAAIDTFYVTEQSGLKILAPERRRHVEAMLREAILKGQGANATNAL